MLELSGQPIPTDAEVAQRSAGSAVDPATPAAFDNVTGQLDQPDVGQGNAQEQAGEAARLGDATGFQVPAVGFEISIHRLDPGPTIVDVQRGTADRLVAEQVPGFVFAFGPIGNELPARQAARYPAAQRKSLRGKPRGIRPDKIEAQVKAARQK